MSRGRQSGADVQPRGSGPPLRRGRRGGGGHEAGADDSAAQTLLHAHVPRHPSRGGPGWAGRRSQCRPAMHQTINESIVHQTITDFAVHQTIVSQSVNRAWSPCRRSAMGRRAVARCLATAPARPARGPAAAVRCAALLCAAQQACLQLRRRPAKLQAREVRPQGVQVCRAQLALELGRHRLHGAAQRGAAARATRGVWDAASCAGNMHGREGFRVGWAPVRSDRAACGIRQGCLNRHQLTFPHVPFRSACAHDASAKLHSRFRPCA